MNKVSVIISVWNGANYLKEAIESALAQDYPNKEVIVVNDGSTDETASIILQFGDAIKSISQKNKGLGAGRNTGVRASTGEYLTFLDHDDLWVKTKISYQMDYMQAHQKEDPLVFTYVEQFICPRLSVDEKNKIVLNNTNLPGYIAGTLLASRVRFEEIGHFMEVNQVGEFVDWYLRATEKNIPVVLLNNVALYRRLHTSNMGRQKNLYQRRDYLKILKAGLDRRRLS